MKSVKFIAGLTAILLSASALGQSAGPIESSSSPEARQAMHAFAACAADKSPDKALKTLLTDFRTKSYREALRTLALDNRKCLGNGQMQSAGILFAAGMAERLLVTRFSPASQTLAQAAANSAPPARNESDALAICVVRSAPAEVASLFATNVASDQETTAAGALSPSVDRCVADGERPVMSTSGLRAILATAALRVAAAQAGQTG